MHSVSRWTRVVGLVALLVQCASSASTPARALSVTPSTNWYGDDGSWSAISIRVGTPQQWLDVIVSTVSSETWVVGSGGCGSPPDAECLEMRGNIFYPQNSSTWHDIGLYYFDVDKQLGNYGYGDYGLEVLTFGSTGVSIPSALVSVFNGSGPTNTTSYFDGMFGVGITPGEFNVTVPKPAISALVEDEAAIPSHSYGFTAGAVYQLKGEPNSLTLGGYDANRFVPHNITFTLNNNQLPQTYINSISVSSANPSNQWSSGEELLFISDRVSAIVDSSTPFLWLPESVCDRFAQSLGLVYDTTVNLYTFGSNSTQHKLLDNSSLTFTFSLSDISTSSTAVNITLPYAAFDLQLMYPAIGKSYTDSNGPMNYFPLRQAASEAQFTIGRAFLQEAYIITDYERNTFSIHQAVHTSDPIGNTSIVAITRPGDSTFSGPPSSKSFPKGGIIGAAIGAAVIIAGMIFIVVYFCKQRRVKRGDSSVDEKSIEFKPSLLSRLLGRQRPPLIHEATGSTNYPTEVGADATHERFELPAPLGPAELDSESGTLDGTTERNSSSGDSSNLTAYERARRKLERQQAAAAAALARPTSEAYPVEKTETDVSQVVHYRAPETESPVSPLGVGPESGGSLTIGGSGTPSPVSPGFVSPPTSPTEAPPPPAYRRINPVNVVYAGRLPDNIQLPKIVPRIIGPDGRTVRADETIRSEDVNLGTNSSLGSHYTENEEIQVQDLYGSGDTHIVSPIVGRHPGSSSGSGSGSGDAEIVSPIQSSSSGNGSHEGGSSRNITTSIPLRPEPNLRGDTQIREMLDPWGSRRRLDGEDLVHIPQPAENRFSWEEERISGNENENGTL